jgi:leader peptidase (prepilin peptidase) / N-methyltransferase
LIVDLHYALTAAAALFGLLLGSFLNVCIYRVPRDISIVFPRSFCPECGAAIAWYDNVPVFSFLLLRARCRHCVQPIGWRYPLVEIVTAALFAAVASRYGLSAAAFKWWTFEAILVVLFCTDLEERLLPDEFTLGGALLGFGFCFVVPVHGSIVDLLFASARVRLRSVVNALSGAAILSVPLWALAKIYERLRQQPEAMGLGDVKLLALLGMYLGFEAGLVAVVIGSLTGAVFGVIYVLVTHQNWRTTSLPFGTFLCLGGALVPLISKQ